MDTRPDTSFELPPAPTISTTHRRRGLFFVGLAVAGVGFALSLQLGTAANFSSDVIGLDGFQQGLL